MEARVDPWTLTGLVPTREKTVGAKTRCPSASGKSSKDALADGILWAGEVSDAMVQVK